MIADRSDVLLSPSADPLSKIKDIDRKKEKKQRKISVCVCACSSTLISINKKSEEGNISYQNVRKKKKK
jgi:hypothetical protein